jgi:hypothetical protein
VTATGLVAPAAAIIAGPAVRAVVEPTGIGEQEVSGGRTAS